MKCDKHKYCGIEECDVCNNCKECQKAREEEERLIELLREKIEKATPKELEEATKVLDDWEKKRKDQ